MKRIKRITPNNLPSRLPVTSTISVYLLLDHIAAPGWAWGVYATLFAILWVCVIVELITREEVDLFKEMP